MTNSFRKDVGLFLDELGASALTISAGIEGAIPGRLIGGVADLSKTFDADGRSSSSFGGGIGVAVGGAIEGGVTLWFRAPWLEISALVDRPRHLSPTAINVF